MRIYFKTQTSEQNSADPLIPYLRPDAGRFDICQDCPLKKALRAMKLKGE